MRAQGGGIAPGPRTACAEKARRGYPPLRASPRFGAVPLLKRRAGASPPCWAGRAHGVRLGPAEGCFSAGHFVTDVFYMSVVACA